MSKSLRDQLVAAGLASANQAKKAEKQVNAGAQARRKKGKKSGSGAEQTETRQRAQQKQAARKADNKEVAKARNSKAAERALRAEIKQIIAEHDKREKKTQENDVAYNFRHKQKIKRIYIPQQQVDQLSSGALVIINSDGIYHLVEKDVADRIAERDPRWIVTRHDPGAEEDMDEYYKQFEVPDDLDW